MPEEHQQWLRDLSGIVNDYPSLSLEPESELGGLACDARGALARKGTPQGLRERTAYTILLYATSGYVAGRVSAIPVFRSYFEALDGIRATLDPVTCACQDGAHPSGIGGEAGIEAGVHLLTEEGRALFARYCSPEQLAAYDCEAFLAGLAEDALGQVREGFDKTFSDVDVSYLDNEFVGADGHIDIIEIQKALGREWEDNEAPVALWSAQRWLSGDVRDEERLGLLLCLWMGTVRTAGGLPPAYARYARAAFATIDTAVACGHPLHPWSAAGVDRVAQERAVKHLYAPKAHPDTPVPPGLSARELWDCPVQHAELARTALASLGEGEDEDA
ncbi:MULTISPECIES: hypothetical protein [unclassified Streptomyces]|uniref:hypothetical protein n=1 Tax=unclassified Streptomyces TaxID=2593676 RepID=UPI001EF150D5|nr:MULTISPECIES: hypothetical protein [unclassified Streptomyces]